MKYVYGTSVAYTIRYMLKRWGNGRTIAMGHNSWTRCASLIIDDYIMRKNNSDRLRYVELRLIIDTKPGEDPIVEEFIGHEREANAWLSEMYDKYNLTPCDYENDYWNGGWADWEDDLDDDLY